MIGRVYMARGIAFKVRAGGHNQIGPCRKACTGIAGSARRPWLRTICWPSIAGGSSRTTATARSATRACTNWTSSAGGSSWTTHPSKVQSMGGNFVHEDDEDTPSNQVFVCQYEKRNLLVQFETREWYTNSEAGMGIEYPFVDHHNVVGVIFYGTAGYLIIPDYPSYYVFLGDDRKPGPNASVPGNPMMDTDHFRNWIPAMRSRKSGDLLAEIEEGHRSLGPGRTWPTSPIARGGRLRSMKRRERFVGDAAADELLTRPYRTPYVKAATRFRICFRTDCVAQPPPAVPHGGKATWTVFSRRTLRLLLLGARAGLVRERRSRPGG